MKTIQIRCPESDEVLAGLRLPDTRESALHRRLVPGGYTAIVQGKNGSTGVALVEVYYLSTP